MIERIRALIPDPTRAHLVPFATTWDDRGLATALGIPMYGCDPKLVGLGSKSAGRRIFREEAVPHPVGREDLADEDALVEAVAGIRRERPFVKRLVVKLNEGASGGGNANLDLRGLPTSGAPNEKDAIRKALPTMVFESSALDYPRFLRRLAERQGIVEERIEADEVRSPSVQLRVTPLGEVEVLSTHDQLLGGASGQSYLGCRFPADAAYAGLISREAEKIGQRLAREGVLGRFALDFIVARGKGGGGWLPYAIEINLRKGGTTHPFLTLQFLTDGTYDPTSAQFRAPNGQRKYFVASDHLESDAYRGLVPDDLFDLALRRGLHFDQSRLTGVVFHMMSALPECGRVGLTALADSPEDAQALYDKVVAAIDEETGAKDPSPRA